MIPTTFNRLSIRDWRQFSEAEIHFHPQLTVLTGANGAGKTTLLNILSQHFGWSRNLLATPILGKDGRLSYFSGVFQLFLQLLNRADEQQCEIGSLHYENNQSSAICVPSSTGVEFGISIQQQQSVAGIHIPSHRVMPRYVQVGNIPTAGINPEQAFGRYYSELHSHYHGNNSKNPPIYRMKEALISMATFGEGNKYVQSRPELLAAYLGFQNALKQMLPASLGFSGLEIRSPDVVMKTATGDFLLDAASGGLSAIIDLTWQIFTFSLGKDRFAVTIDEPENHLHPSMQRTLLANLIKTFPTAQFIVATHSPFVVTSVHQSNVYVLRYRDVGARVINAELPRPPERSIEAVALASVNKAATANEILREVLGMDTTLPIWAAEAIESTIDDFRERTLDIETLRELKARLSRVGLESAMSKVIRKVAET